MLYYNTNEGELTDRADKGRTGTNFKRRARLADLAEYPIARIPNFDVNPAYVLYTSQRWTHVSTFVILAGQRYRIRVTVRTGIRYRYVPDQYTDPVRDS